MDRLNVAGRTLLRSIAAAVPVCLAACGGWVRADHITDLAPEAAERVQVWRADSRTTLSAVRVAADTLTGLPWPQPGPCDTCRVAFPVVEIDSVRVSAGTTELGTTGTVAAAVVVVILAWPFIEGILGIFVFFASGPGS